MRKLILAGLVAATAIPTVALPTIAGAQPRQIRHDRREVRQDRREVRQDRRELRQDRNELRGDRGVRYVAPYRGWAYRTLTPGFRLQPAFWGPRYVVNFNTYRLHAPRFGEQWIRYGDDLLLVNVRTGRVIEVIRNRW